MAVYQDKAKERIKKGLAKYERLVDKALAEKWQEADTRKIVQGVLTDLLGWDEFENLTAEYMVRGQYADIVIQEAGDILFIVEIKQVGLKLKTGALTQALTYAVNEGVEWIILTNGGDWQVYHVVFQGKIPDPRHVFSVRLTDKDTKPQAKTNLLYLLSREAYRKRELDDHYDRYVALSGENLAGRLLTDEVLDKLRVGIKRDLGFRVENGDIAKALRAHVFVPELMECQPPTIKKKPAAKKQSTTQAAQEQK